MVVIKKMVPNHVVIFVSTFPVLEPKRVSVTALPKAVPKPSLRGRCIKTIKVSRMQTTIWTASKKPIKMSIIRKLAVTERLGRRKGFLWIIFCSAHDGCETVRIEAGATDENSINIRLIEKSFDIRGFDTATILDTDFSSLIFPEHF